MAKWKKIIVSGSDAELNNVTGSGLRLNNLPGVSGTTPLVIDSNGNVSTGSAYALASGGNTAGGSGLDSNIAIIGAGGSLIQTASSTQKVDFNSADLGNINVLEANGAVFQGLRFSGSFDGTGSHILPFGIDFLNTGSANADDLSSYLGISEAAASLTFNPKLTSIKLSSPVTMSSVPGGSTETKVLMLDSSGHVVTRSSGDIGGVTSVAGGTNISTDSDTGAINVSLDENISLTSVTASAGLFFSSSINKNYRIDYAKVYSASSNILEPTSGSLTITASGIKVEGDLTASGSVTLDGALSFNGFNFVESSISVVSGSTQFGSGSTGSDIPLTTHQFTGSVLITGSKLELTNGTLSIPGFNDVSASLATLGVAANLVTNVTFNAFSSSYSQSVVDFLTTSESLANEVNTFKSFSSSFSQSVTDFNTNLGIFNSFSQSYSQSVQDFLAASESFESSVASFTSFSSSFSSSIDTLTAFSESIITAITVDGTDTEFQNNVTIKGNLDVQGTTTTINTQDLSVEDRFIILGSGSSNIDSNLDVGIIFDSGSKNGEGMALFFDHSVNRLSVGKNVINSSHSLATDTVVGEATLTPNNIGDASTNSTVGGQIVTVKTAQSSPPSGSASSSFGEGEVYIDNNNDIYIYVE